MDNILINAIRVIEGIKINLLNFHRAFLFTTENISGFSKKISFKNKKILTVCSSGDQAFNMALNEANEIDLFDINIFSKYYFRLKEAAIKSLSYDEFLDFFTHKNIFCSNVFSVDTYLKLRDNILDDDIRKFWDYLFCHYPGKVIYKSKLFFKADNSRKKYIECNDYLKNESNYNKLKDILKNKKFNFYNLDLFNDKIPNNKKYDFIYLSNIFDCLYISNALEYIKKIKEIVLDIKNNLTENGRIAVSYLYFYCDDCYTSNNINSLNTYWIRKETFDDANYIVFPGANNPFSRQIRDRDALMLCKK